MKNPAQIGVVASEGKLHASVHGAHSPATISTDFKRSSTARPYNSPAESEKGFSASVAVGW